MPGEGNASINPFGIRYWNWNDPPMTCVSFKVARLGGGHSVNSASGVAVG